MRTLTFLAALLVTLVVSAAASAQIVIPVPVYK